MTSPPPVAQVAPVPRNNGTSCPQPMQPQQASVISQPPPPAQTPSGKVRVLGRVYKLSHYVA